MYSSFKKVRVC